MSADRGQRSPIAGCAWAIVLMVAMIAVGVSVVVEISRVVNP